MHLLAFLYNERTITNVDGSIDLDCRTTIIFALMG